MLADHEIKVLWKACGDDRVRPQPSSAALTGCRRDEIGALRWSEADSTPGGLNAAARATKNRRTLSLPLPPPAFDILRTVSRNHNPSTSSAAATVYVLVGA